MKVANSNRQIIFVARPRGVPDERCFSLKNAPMPHLKEEGQVLLRTLYLSVDPYMRGRMNQAAAATGAFVLNESPTGGCIAEVISSKSHDLKKGDIVFGFLEWAEYSISSTKDLKKLPSFYTPITSALGIYGMPGMTAYFGMLKIGQPKNGETVVISAAAGAVGLVAGQIAKIKGCRVVGIVGSDQKVDVLTKEFGFDAAINYNSPDFEKALRRVCPQGVDVYFDNVGGDITDRVLEIINKHARIVLCGQISVYNLEKSESGIRNFPILLTKTAMAKGFMVYEYLPQFSDAIHEIAHWVKEGKLKYREHIVNGLENVPKAFLGLFKGDNIGKVIVKVAKI